MEVFRLFRTEGVERWEREEGPIEGEREVTIAAADWFMHGDEEDAVEEAALDLDLVELAGHAREDLAAAEQAFP